tara:strand:- start:121 stop:825 length:705 start_codon:yes stop_codon:yes gene_type:complete
MRANAGRPTSPFNEFCQAQRPLLPPGLQNWMKEKLLGQTWKALSQTEKAKWEAFLMPLPSCGRGGARVWADVTDATLENIMADDEAVKAGGAQSSAALTAPFPAGSGLDPPEATTEAIPADLVGGEEAIGLHGIPPDQAELTPGQQALHIARQCMKISHTDTEVCQVVRTLAVALGASRTEAGTIKALHALLKLLERPEMSEEEAYTSTGASVSNFKRWKKKVQSAQLGVALPN